MTMKQRLQEELDHQVLFLARTYIKMQVAQNYKDFYPSAILSFNEQMKVVQSIFYVAKGTKQSADIMEYLEEYIDKNMDRKAMYDYWEAYFS